MSGHSKWHNIQGRKGKQDKVKSGLFTKYAKLISVAARQGGGDPSANFTLRLAIDKARAVNMPKDNIERAIKKGTGELNDGTIYEELIYEGYGPGSVALMVDIMTDNRNRTASEIKHMFAENGGSVAGPGSVQWQFDKFGVVRIETNQIVDKKIAKENFELSLIETGAEDILNDEYGMEIRTAPENLRKVLEVVKNNNLEPADAGLEWVAKEQIELDANSSELLQKLVEELEGHDDVRGVYTNEK